MRPWAGRGALGDPGAPGRGGEEAEELEGLQRDRKAGLPVPPGPHSSLTHRRVRVPAAAGAAAEAALRAGSEAADPSDGCRCRPLRRRASSRSPATLLPAAPPGPASGLTQPRGPAGRRGERSRTSAAGEAPLPRTRNGRAGAEGESGSRWVGLGTGENGRGRTRVGQGGNVLQRCSVDGVTCSPLPGLTWTSERSLTLGGGGGTELVLNILV